MEGSDFDEIDFFRRIALSGVPTVEGVRVAFDDVWERRRSLPLAPGVDVAIPCISDLIATKRFAARPKDLEDIRLLETLQGEDEVP